MQIREHVRVRPIYTDEGGGPDGIPVDYFYLGELHEVRLELYKWDENALAVVRARLPNVPKGNTHIGEPGWMMRQGNSFFRLQLVSQKQFSQEQPVFAREYHVALPLSSIEYPLGPKEMIVLMEWTCLPDATGQLFSMLT